MHVRREWLREVNGRLTWIREVDGKLIVSDHFPGARGVERELTRKERIAWRLARRPPKQRRARLRERA